MKHRAIRVLSAVLALLLFSFSAVAVGEAGTEMPVTVNAKSAILVDVSTGRVLCAMNEHDKLYPASVTKIMTLLLIMEAIEAGEINLNDPVTASPTAVSKGGSQIWLKEGETMTVDELLRATAIYSANDACEALGEYLTGSEEALVKTLNERAAQLGMNDTNFDNCTGLDDTTDSHLTSAYDIALMSVDLLKHELIERYTTVWMDSLRGGATELVNTNKLVRFYDGCTGLKTGTTSKAGCCVAASARRSGTHLVAVIMGSPSSDDRFNGAKALLNWGFANYETITPQIDSALISEVKVLKGFEESFMPSVPEISPVLVEKGSGAKVEQSVALATDVSAPVEAGQRVGTLTFMINGEVVGEYPLTAPKAIKALSFGEVLRRFLCAFERFDAK